MRIVERQTLSREGVNIHEYQGKALFREEGVAVQEGVHCTTVDQAMEAYDSLESKVVAVKSQIHAGGRGKGNLYCPDTGNLQMEGGVKIASSRDEVETYSKNILGNILVTKQSGPEGKMVNNLYIEAGCEIAHEYYLALLVDREKDAILVMASTEGGVDIEEVAETTPQAIHKAWTDSSGKLPMGADSAMADSLGLTGSSKDSFKEMLGRLVSMFVSRDCSMVEINPLVRTEDGAMIALDSKISFDDNASFRHPWRAEMRDMSEEEEVEIRANKSGLSYVKLDGNIGCLVNGAGLAMATMDIIKMAGGNPANFLDVGGTADAARVEKAFRIILQDENVKAILVNIFGGIVRCDRVAQGIIDAYKNIEDINIPIIVRLQGTNAEVAKEMIDNSGLEVHSAIALAEAASKVQELVG